MKRLFLVWSVVLLSFISGAQAVSSRPPAANYILVGTDFYNQGKYEQAYVAFRAATETEPKNTAALLGLGRSQMRLRLYDAAIVTLQNLIQQAPDHISGYIALSQVYTQMKGDYNKNLDQALQTILKAEQLLTSKKEDTQVNTDKSKLLNEKGNIYRLKGDIDNALLSFSKAALLNPENSFILYNLSDTYHHSGNTEKAIEYIQSALIIDPSDAYHRAYYAKLLAKKGNYKAALLESGQAVKLSPQNAYAVGQDGIICYLNKDSVSARKQLDKAIQLDPLRFPEFYYYLGRLDLDVNDLKSARNHFTKSAALDIKNPEYLYYLGLSYEKGNRVVPSDTSKARASYKMALDLQPTYQSAIDGIERLK